MVAKVRTRWLSRDGGLLGGRLRRALTALGVQWLNADRAEMLGVRVLCLLVLRGRPKGGELDGHSTLLIMTHHAFLTLFIITPIMYNLLKNQFSLIFY